MKVDRGILVGSATIVALAALWYVTTDLGGLISPGRFPGPSDTYDAFHQVAFREYANGRLDEHILNSLKLILYGFTAASVVGVPLGLLMGWNPRAEAMINPVFLLIRPIPPLAWIPLAILWLGLGDAAKVLVIWFAAFVPAVINTYTGVKAIDPATVEAGRMLGTPRLRFVREVMVPASLPMIFTGLRLSLQASWTTLVAAELVGALYGLGRVLNVAQQDIYPGMILVGMVCVAILGWSTTRLLGAVEHRALPWLNVRA